MLPNFDWNSRLPTEREARQVEDEADLAPETYKYRRWAERMALLAVCSHNDPHSRRD